DDCTQERATRKQSSPAAPGAAAPGTANLAARSARHQKFAATVERWPSRASAQARASSGLEDPACPAGVPCARPCHYCRRSTIKVVSRNYSQQFVTPRRGSRIIISRG